MEPLLRTSLIIFGAVLIRHMILEWWDRYKARKALQPIPLVWRKGAYRQWGTVQKVQHYGGIFGLIYLAQFVVLLVIAIWVMAHR